MTKVKFYIEPTGGVMAFFPEIIEHTGKNGMIYYSCYSHVCQHSSLDILYLNDCKVASKAQYSDLFTELVSVGYTDLEVQTITKKELLKSDDFSGYINLPCGYELITLYYGGQYLHYYLFNQDGIVLFYGHDYKPSQLMNIDSIESIVTLLGWLCLKPGDTDSEYFTKYTPEQLAFTESVAQHEISLLVADFEDENSQYNKQAVKYFTTNYRQDLSPMYGMYNLNYRDKASHNPNTDILIAHLSKDEYITYYFTESKGVEGMECYRGTNYVPGSLLPSYSRMWVSGKIPNKYIKQWIELKWQYNNLYK